MSIQQLRYVVAAIRSNSNVQAAASVVVSPQAISKAIAATEKQYGAKLFDRGGGNRIPTDFAIAFANKAEPIIEEYDDLEAMGKQLPVINSQKRGDIRIALAITPYRG